MGNRRKLPSEKARRLRCPRCRSRDYDRKVFADGAVVLVCRRCNHDWSDAHTEQKGAGE